MSFSVASSDTEPAEMPNKYQSVIQFRRIKVDSGQYSFHDQASFQVKFFISSLIFYILSRKRSTERKFGT